MCQNKDQKDICSLCENFSNIFNYLYNKKKIVIGLILVALVEFINMYLQSNPILPANIIHNIIYSALLLIITSMIVISIYDINKRSKVEDIMEDELHKKDRLLECLANATSVLISSNNYPEAFSRALGILGMTMDVDRVYIFRNHLIPGTEDIDVSQVYEWCAENVKAEISNPQLQNISYKKMNILRWYDSLSKGRVINGLVKDFPESEQELLKPQGIISLLAVPILIDGIFWGFIGFDDCHRERLWSKIEETILLAAAANFGNVIKRKQAEEDLQQALQNDFRQTVQNLQNLVYKVKKNENGMYYFTLFEGKLARELGLSTDYVFEKNPFQVFPHSMAEYLNIYFEKAFNGLNYSFELEYIDKYFLTALSPVFENDIVVEVVGSVIDITEHKEAEEQIRHMSYYDSLTGLPNRLLFSDRVNIAISHAHRCNLKMAVMFLDLDRFKNINDTLGHFTGDILLQEVSVRLKNCVRVDDTVTRLGGDEFAILLPEINHEENVINIARKILEAFKQPFRIKEHEFFITTSIGISIYPLDAQDLDTLVKNADIAMYRAKENGKNNYQFYTLTMNERALEKLVIENNLRRALEKNEFFLNYQPLVDFQTGKITGCEALIRWHHPDLGVIPPGDFISLAEETGLIVPIGEWVLYTACLQLKSWHNAGYPHLRISVNISARQFQKSDLVETIVKILKKTDLNPSFINLEITENNIMQNTQKNLETINKLKSLGVKICIDDFGTGFSSLSYLKLFEVDALKIDKSFINDIVKNSNDKLITSAIINMAHSLNLKVIAEGVETLEQFNYLKQQNCNTMQGYYFSKPVSAYEIEKMLTDKEKRQTAPLLQ